MSKQTAVEWLIEKLNQCEPFYSSVLSLNHKHYIDGLIEQAKAMEKELIIETFKYAQTLHAMGDETRAEQYYNKTYKNK